MRVEHITRPLQHPLPFKLVIFDTDGTLSRCTVEGQPCPNKPGEWELMPNVKAVLGLYDWSGAHRWGMASNQGGVGLGFFSYEIAWQLQYDRAKEAGLPTHFAISDIVPYAMCPHRPRDGCICRKPSPYLLFQIADTYGIPFGRDILFVGDMMSDKYAAENAGVFFCWAWDFFGWPPPTTILKG